MVGIQKISGLLNPAREQKPSVSRFSGESSESVRTSERTEASETRRAEDAREVESSSRRRDLVESFFAGRLRENAAHTDQNSSRGGETAESGELTDSEGSSDPFAAYTRESSEENMRARSRDSFEKSYPSADERGLAERKVGARPDADAMVEEFRAQRQAKQAYRETRELYPGASLE